MGHKYVWEKRCISQLIILALGGVYVVCFALGLIYPKENDHNPIEQEAWLAPEEVWNFCGREKISDR
jgi:hypothetical protein